MRAHCTAYYVICNIIILGPLNRGGLSVWFFILEHLTKANCPEILVVRNNVPSVLQTILSLGLIFPYIFVCFQPPFEALR